MAGKKPKDEPQLSAQELLEARVDAMMDPKAQVVTTAPADPVGAPTLPGKKAVATPVVEPTSEEPIVEPTPVGASVATEEDIQVGPSNLDTAQSDAAIDDIVAQEADEVLAAEDAGIANAQLAAETASEKPEKHGHPVWWFMVAFFALVVVIVAVMLVNPNLTPSFAP